MWNSALRVGDRDHDFEPWWLLLRHLHCLLPRQQSLLLMGLHPLVVLSVVILLLHLGFFFCNYFRKGCHMIAERQIWQQYGSNNTNCSSCCFCKLIRSYVTTTYIGPGDIPVISLCFMLSSAYQRLLLFCRILGSMVHPLVLTLLLYLSLLILLLGFSSQVLLITWLLISLFLQFALPLIILYAFILLTILLLQ